MINKIVLMSNQFNIIFQMFNVKKLENGHTMCPVERIKSGMINLLISTFNKF